MEIYVVKSGDNLYQIAQRFGVSEERIINDRARRLSSFTRCARIPFRAVKRWKALPGNTALPSISCCETTRSSAGK